MQYAKDEGAKDLSKAHFLDAGFDLASPKEVICKPHKVTLVDTGIHVDLSSDEFAFIQPRSSTAGLGLFVITGTIDAGYTGSLKIQIINMTDEDVVIEEGQRVAQMIVIANARAYESASLVPLSTITDSNFCKKDSRKINGFGSSGK